MATQSVSVATVPATLTSKSIDAQKSIVTRILTTVSSLDRAGMGLLRVGLVVVLVWIGGLKFAGYEADSIVPLVANSPVTSFLYHHPAEYKHYMNKGGRTEAGEQGVASLQWNLSGFLWTWSHHCVAGPFDRLVPGSAGTFRNR